MAKTSKSGNGKTRFDTTPPPTAGENDAPVHVPVERKRYTQKLPVRIEPDAIAKIADTLAAVVGQRLLKLQEKREANAVFREEIAALNERERELAESVRDSTEMRDVECIECLVVETSEVIVRRADTGEIVESRVAHAADRQETIDLEGDDEDDDSLRPISTAEVHELFPDPPLDDGNPEDATITPGLAAQIDS